LAERAAAIIMTTTTTDHVKVFTGIYEGAVWGDNQQFEYRGSSGPGSDVRYNIGAYVPFLKAFIRDRGVRSVVDLGCGDFRCGKFVYEDLDDVTYTGYDAYAKVVEHNRRTHDPAKYTFHHLDFCNSKEAIQSADLCILKDVLQHWSTHEIYAMLDYLTTSGKFRYILICNCCDQRADDVDVPTGGWRPLSSVYLPLRRYGAQRLLAYGTKEVSCIEVVDG
jgi:hypothetical protein